MKLKKIYILFKRINLSISLAFIIAITSTLFFVLNTLNHHPFISYDYGAHIEMLEYYAKPNTFDLVAPDAFRFSYNAPIYYLIVGKTHLTLETISNEDFNPYYTARAFHLVFILIIWYLLTFKLLNRLVNKDIYKSIFTLLFFLLPNLYLSQVMVRADHLGFFAIGLMFFFWFYYNLFEKLHLSKWRILVWCVLLILIGNSRHILLPIWGIFFVLGAYRLVKHNIKVSTSKISLTLFILTITLILSLNFYILRYVYTGSATSFASKDFYAEKYQIYERYRSFRYKLDMLTNIEFLKMIETPNRNAVYGDYPSTLIGPSFIQKDLFESLVAPELEEKGVDKNIYKLEGEYYKLDSSIDEYLQAEATAIVYGKVNFNNSYFPRLVNDMWGDHWVYFSGEKPSIDDEVDLKRVVLLLTLPLTFIYFFINLNFIYISVIKRELTKVLAIEYLAGLLFSLCFSVLTVFSVFIFSEAGKNSIVKFVYLIGFFYLPFLPMIAWLKDKKKLTIVTLIYLIIIYIVSLKLYIY